MGLLVNLVSRDAMGAGRARADAISGLMPPQKGKNPLQSSRRILPEAMDQPPSSLSSEQLEQGV